MLTANGYLPLTVTVAMNLGDRLTRHLPLTRRAEGSSSMKSACADSAAFIFNWPMGVVTTRHFVPITVSPPPTFKLPEMLPLPATSRLTVGALVPIPTFPMMFSCRVHCQPPVV